MKASELFNSESGNYFQFIKSQIEVMNVDETKSVNIGGKCKVSFRATLNRVSSQLGYKLKTKIIDGDMIVGRIE